jgi:hypothetical protein
MPQGEYFSLLQSVSVAFFGHRRQEGGNNIYYFLASGAKVFLRKENNLLRHLKERGYYVFDFEQNFQSDLDLQPLSVDAQRHNNRLVKEEFSKERIDEVYCNLITSQKGK